MWASRREAPYGSGPWCGGEWSPLERPAKPCQKSGAKAGRQCQSFGKRSRPYLPQVVPADPIAGAVHPFSENATLVPLALRQRDNRCDLVGYDIEEPITDGPSDFHCHVTLSSALPLDVDSLVVRSGRMDLSDRAKHLFVEAMVAGADIPGVPQTTIPGAADKHSSRLNSTTIARDSPSCKPWGCSPCRLSTFQTSVRIKLRHRQPETFDLDRTEERVTLAAQIHKR